MLAAFYCYPLGVLSDSQYCLAGYDGWLAMLPGFEALLVVSSCWLTESYG